MTKGSGPNGKFVNNSNIKTELLQDNLFGQSAFQYVFADVEIKCNNM
jgi:hypothetical protein